MTLDLPVLLPRLIAAAIILLVSFPVHEAAHAYAAYRLGDGTAKMFGRLTLNPIVHFDPNLRGGTDSEGIVAFAGPASNLVLAAIGAIPLRILFATHARVPFEVYEVLIYFVLINIALMLFNLVPIPPLDGSKVLFSMMNPRQVWQWRPTLEQYGFILLIFVAFVPLLPGPDGSQTVFQFIFQKIGDPIVNFLIGQSVF